jgi:hypothetical protein
MLIDEWPGIPQTRQPLLTGRARRLMRKGFMGMGFAPAGVISRTTVERMTRDWRTRSAWVPVVGDDIAVAPVSVAVAAVSRGCFELVCVGVEVQSEL